MQAKDQHYGHNQEIKRHLSVSKESGNINGIRIDPFKNLITQVQKED